MMRPQIDDADLAELFDNVELPLVSVLAELEYNGIHVDPEELERQRALLTERTKALRDQITWMRECQCPR